VFTQVLPKHKSFVMRTKCLYNYVNLAFYSQYIWVSLAYALSTISMASRGVAHLMIYISLRISRFCV